MKKVFMALATVFALAGCSSPATTPDSNNATDNQVALDVASFTTQMETTDKNVIRVFITTEGSRENATLDTKVKEDETLYTAVKEVIEGLSAEKAENQDQLYGNPFYMVELGGPLDDSFLRFVVYGDGMLTIANNDAHVNYTVDLGAFSSLETLATQMSGAAE